MKPMTIALSLSLMLAGSAAFAQQTIDGQPVTEGDLGAVADRCEELQHQQGTTGTQEPETTISEEASGPGGDNANTNANEATGIDIEGITLEKCQAGGFITGNTDGTGTTDGANAN